MGGVICIMSDKKQGVNAANNNLRKIIDQSGMTREQVAKKIGCDTSSITKYYNGERNPKTDIVIKLAKLFNTTTDYLLGLTDVQTMYNDLRFVCEYTGLSEKAIEKLHDLEFDSDTLMGNVSDFMAKNREALDEFKIKDEIIDYKKLFNFVNASSLPNYSIAADKFIRSRFFDEILSSFISQNEVSKQIIKMNDINENRIEVDQLSDDDLYCLYLDVRMTDFKNTRKMDLFTAQENVIEFIKTAIEYDDDEARIANILGDYLEAQLDVREYE